MTLFKSPLAKRRWENFKANRRAHWSLWIFGILFLISLFAEFIANDKPLLVKFQGQLHSPVIREYTEEYFGGDFQTEAVYNEIEVECLIITGGIEACLDDPEGLLDDAQDGLIDGAEIQKGWMVWPLIPYSFNTVNYEITKAPSAPDTDHWLGTDDQTRDVVARVIYGFRISTFFALVVTFLASALGIAAGAAMGFFGGKVDLIGQRLIEIWDSTPGLYIIIIISSILTINFTVFTVLIVAFSWTALTGVVRAEFLRARNFEYVRAARAMGVSDRAIMFRHLLPNAMVATLTMLPFIITGSVGALTSLDFLGYGLPPEYPSLGRLALQAKNNLQAPWLIFSAFTSLALLLCLLVFIFEGVRDAFDPRKTFK